MSLENCRVSIISQADIRYEGKLLKIEKEEKIIFLKDVKSFGTEDRRKDDPIPPSQSTYNLIRFKGSDIKDIKVLGDSISESKEQDTSGPVNTTSTKTNADNNNHPIISTTTTSGTYKSATEGLNAQQKQNNLIIEPKKADILENRNLPPGNSVNSQSELNEKKVYSAIALNMQDGKNLENSKNLKDEEKEVIQTKLQRKSFEEEKQIYQNSINNNINNNNNYYKDNYSNRYQYHNNSNNYQHKGNQYKRNQNYNYANNRDAYKGYGEKGNENIFSSNLNQEKRIPFKNDFDYTKKKR